MLGCRPRNPFTTLTGCAVFFFAMMLSLTALCDESPATKVEDKPAIIHGVIRNEDQGPLIGVRVRVAVPETDMRFLGIEDSLMDANEKSVTVLETKTV